jgi:cytoskeletal protein CcmA (bactofilin family)
VSEPRDRTMQHVDEMTCLLYLERQLDRQQAQQVSSHTAECDPCRTLLRALEREAKLLARALSEEEEPLPMRIAEWRVKTRYSLQWIWAILFGLAATGVYALYTGYIQPWQQQLEQAGFGGTNLLGLLVFQGAFWKGWQSMVTLFEVLALLIVGGFGWALVRRRVRRGTVLAVMMAGFCAAFALAPAASATEFRKGESVEIKKDETIKGDTYLSGARARMDGTVEGDLFIFSKEAEVTGHVTGDVIAFAQSLRVSGQVDGNVRSFVNNVTILGSVSKNLMVFGESGAIDSAGKVSGSVTMFGSRLNVDGQLGGDVLSFGDHVDINGKVGGGIHAKGNTLSIGSGAEVDGHVYFEGRNPVEVASGAKLAFPVEFHKEEHKREEAGAKYYIWKVIWTAAFILLGLVLFALMPRFAGETTESATHPAAIGVGLLVLVGLPVASGIACATIVGVPLGILGFSVFVFLLITAQIVVGSLVGRWILGPTRETWDLIGRMALGLIILRAVGIVMAHIPIIHALYPLAIILVGLGAVSMAVYRRFAGPSSGAGSMQAPPPPPLPTGTTIGGVQPA